MWYGVTLCPCVDCPAQKCLSSKCTSSDPLYQKPEVYQGVALEASQSCRVNPPMTESEGSTQTFELEQKLFSMDGLNYNPILYRTEGAAKVVFRITDDDGELLIAGNVEAQSDGDVVVVPATEEADEAMQPQQTDDEEAPTPKSRSLMKGGRSAAGTSRSRSGAAGRWGSGKSARKTGYGHSSCCVSRGTVIFVNRPGPRTNRGYYDTDTDQDGYDDCTSSSNGCVFETSADMTRDELDTYSFQPTRDLAWPLHLHVDLAQSTSYWKDRKPELYFSFWTEDPDNGKVSSYVLLPLGCVMIVFPGFFFLFKN
jgi:hypothetical protein